MEILNCPCGKKHICSIDEVVIKSDIKEDLIRLTKDYVAILLVCDHNTYRVLGKDISETLNNIETTLVLDDNGPVLVPNQEKIDEITSHISISTDLIIGVGSGVINDLCKIVGFRQNLPYYICPTAPSMDGFASNGSALMLDGMKITLNAKPPKAIIACTKVIKDAPMDMIRAGYGDIIGKFSCLNDWKLSHIINDEYICENIWQMTYDTAVNLKPLADKIQKRDEDAIGDLVKALVDVGIYMSYIGNSRPASGSEHHLSHFFEVTGLLDNKPYLSHGIDVLFSAVKTAEIREQIINGVPNLRTFDKTEWKLEMERLFKGTAEGMIELQNKAGWYDKDDEEIIIKKWPLIVKTLKEAPSEEEMKEIVSKIGLNIDDFEKTYGKEKIGDAVLYAKDIKDRYTVLWLYYKYFRRIWKNKWIVSAHRGFVTEGMHENTMSAFIKAAKMGAEMIETDARTTIDGVLVANHDPVAVGFDKNGEKKELVVSETTSAEITSLVLAPNDPSGVQCVPLLKDILLLAKKTGMMVNIDLKEGIKHAKDVAELVLDCGMAGRVVYATNGAGAEAINMILEMDPKARFIDRTVNYTKEKLKDVNNYETKCFAYTSNFSEENIKSIRESGCMLATISLNNDNYKDAFKWNPEMAEYPHTSDFVQIERDYSKNA